MADGGLLRLNSIQVSILEDAVNGDGLYGLRDDDPDRAEKRLAIAELRSYELMWNEGSDDGYLYYRLSKKGWEVARVVCAS